MSITAIVENGTVKLPVSLPEGTRVEIRLPNDWAACAAGGPSPEVLQVFRKLWREIGLSAEAASAWKKRVAAARR